MTECVRISSNLVSLNLWVLLVGVIVQRLFNATFDCILTLKPALICFSFKLQASNYLYVVAPS